MYEIMEHIDAISNYYWTIEKIYIII